VEIKVKRLYHDHDTTLGALFIGDYLVGFTCEDEPREDKVAGETRIPAGEYQLGVRKGSPMAKKYDARYPEHDGMLWIKDVPGFEYIYFHTGNTEADSEGCILVGLTASVESMSIGRSRACYQDFYSLVRPHVDDCTVIVEDEWNPSTRIHPSRS